MVYFSKHGHCSGGVSPTYQSWVAMKSRCDNPGATGYAQYGGAGIRYAGEWASFEVFLAYMGERPEGRSLDRIDGAKGYSPDNCRWATRRQQRLNQRGRKNVMFEGREWSIRELSEHLGLAWDTLNYRLRRGWSEEQIRDTPASRGNCLKVTKGWHERVPWNKGLKKA